MHHITKDYIAYDYIKLEVLSELEQLYIDCYQSFGWQLTSISEINMNQDYYINGRTFPEKNLITLKFKRNRKIKNKAELLTLQNNMEDYFKKIAKLKKEPELIGTMYSMIFGVIGLLFIIFSFLSFTSTNPFLGIINGIIGSIDVILAFFMYNKKRKQLQEKNEILIEELYNLIHEQCEKAYNLVG